MPRTLSNDDGEEGTLNTELFVDLLFTAKRIINLTSSDDILILIGESPAYLGPILKHHRKIIYLPMSRKPFSCYRGAHYNLENIVGTSYEDEKKLTGMDKKLYYHMLATSIPTQKGLDKYFSYLNKETILTKKFAKDNWNNLVGIDTSSGASANGTSIFLNKYADNIKPDTKCENISKAKPLKFINLLRFDGISAFNKNLIDATHIMFYHTKEFIDSLYKRFVPSYPAREWEKVSINEKIEKYYKEDQLVKKEIYDLYSDFKTNKPKLLKWIKDNCKKKKLTNLLKKEMDLDEAIVKVFNYVTQNYKMDVNTNYLS